MRSNILAGIRQRVERLAGVAGERDSERDLAEMIAILDQGRQRAREAPPRPPSPPWGSAAYEAERAAAVQRGRDLRAKMRAAGYRV